MRHGNHQVPQPETGLRIRALRTARGLSTHDFEPISPSSLSRFEAGLRTPSMHILVEIADRLRVTALELASGGRGHCPYCGRGSGRKPPLITVALLVLVIVIVFALESADLIIPGTNIKEALYDLVGR